MNFEKIGLHCPIDLFGRKVHRFAHSISNLKSDVYIIKGEVEVNAKSLLGILSLTIRKGDNIIISCNNEDKSLAKMELNHVVTVLNGLGADETM